MCNSNPKLPRFDLHPDYRIRQIPMSYRRLASIQAR
jgi:hypothetical protein